MKLYIAGPMTGIANLNYPEFMRIEEILKQRGFSVENPARVDYLHSRELKMLMLGNSCGVCSAGKNHDWEWYMKRTIAMLIECDGVALLRGWDASRGAIIEHDLAVKLGMPVKEWERWGDPNAWANKQAENGDKETRTISGAEAYERYASDPMLDF